MTRRTLLTALFVATLAPNARAELPALDVADLGEAGSLPRLYRGPDDRLHLLYLTGAGFHWRVWDAGKWNDAGVVPSTSGQGKSKFNNPSIVALPDGSFHVLWGPPASWGVSHDVYLQSHDGSSWGTRQTILPDYTEYVELAPLSGNQLMVIGGIVCPTGCTTALKLAYSAGAPGQAFSGWTALPVAQAEGKTPHVFVQPASDVFHLVSRWARVSYLRWDGTQFGKETLLLPPSPYSVALPTVSAGPGGTPVIAGVEWMGSGTNWAIDHVRIVRGDGASGWIPDAQGEKVQSVAVDKSAVSADSNGGVHLFYLAKTGELSYRYWKGSASAGPAVIVSGVDFSGPETEKIAVSYTAHHVHVVVPTAASLKHVLIQTDPPASDAGVDAAPDAASDASGGAAGTGGTGGGSGGAAAGKPGGTTAADDEGCGCRVTGRHDRPSWLAWVLGLVLVLRARRRTSQGHASSARRRHLPPTPTRSSPVPVRCGDTRTLRQTWSALARAVARLQLAAAVLVAWAGESAAEPLREDVRGLLADVERVVSVEQSLGWFVDRRAYEEVLPALLQSVCRAAPAARLEARAELQRRSREVGDSRMLYTRAGHELDGKTQEALFIERQLGALDHAMKRADEDCPFYVEPEPDFIGRQTDRNRFTLSLETGGMLQLRRTEGDWTFGGGGTARILPGWGFGGAVTLLAGGEFGGGAMIRPNVRPTQLAINYFPAIPVVVRFHDVSWHYDLELAPVALFQADDQDFSYGVRIGGTIGVAALRTRGFLPWAGLAVACERYFENDARAAATFIRGGLRVGLMWDP